MKTDAWCIRLQAILAGLMIAACTTAPLSLASTPTVTTVPPAVVTTAQTPTRVLPTNTLLPSPTRTPVATPTSATTATSTPAGLALPPTRRGAGLVLDEARGQLVLFGGIGIAPQGVFSDTWLYEGVNWVEGHPAVAPPARDSATMVYDPGSQTVVLFGGVNVEGQLLGDTWLWNGTEWSEPKLTTAPSPRNDASLVYDAKHHHVLLFGGEGAVPGSDRAMTGLNDTWAWHGKAWIELFPPTSPSKRSQANMAYDATRQNVVLIGGNLPAGDT